MRRAVAIQHEGIATDSVTLTFDDRHRRRLRLVTDKGSELLLDLPEAHVLHEGDRLRLDDDILVAVRAAAEDVMDVRAASPMALTRLAWHLGNRHTPAQILDGALRIRADHVLEQMLLGLGATVERRAAPFDPEGGAYAGGHGHDH